MSTAALDFSEIDGLLGDRARLIEHPVLGRTLEARRHIAPGELILAEVPLLIASGPRALPSKMRRQYQTAADAGDVNLDDLLIMHAFASEHGQRARLGSTPARLLCPLSARLMASGSLVLPE